MFKVGDVIVPTSKNFACYMYSVITSMGERIVVMIDFFHPDEISIDKEDATTIEIYYQLYTDSMSEE